MTRPKHLSDLEPGKEGGEPESADHRWRISSREYARMEARRGRRHSVERLDATRTALVVVDMVAFFVDENPYARGIVERINTLAAALRVAGGTIAWVLPADNEAGPAMVEHYGARIAERYRRSAGDGPLAERVASELIVEPTDLVVEKRSAGAFFPGRCDLDHQLRERNIDTVLVTGTVANVCCESTAREASTLGYRTVMVADANAARTDRDLNATLYTVYRSFGDVRPTDELLTLIVGSGMSGAASTTP